MPAAGADFFRQRALRGQLHLQLAAQHLLFKQAFSPT
jgi:hypothetical protein